MADDDVPDEADEPAPTQLPNVPDEPAAKRKESRRKLEKREEIEFWRRVFADPAGRRAMWKILQESSAFQLRFACAGNGAPYTEAMWFQAGQSEMGHRLWKQWMAAAREGCLLMMTEHDPELF